MFRELGGLEQLGIVVVFSGPMLTARPAAAPTLYQGGNFDPEFERVLRIGNPGAALRRALTFLPAEGLATDAWLTAWEAWRVDVLTAKLAPVLIAVANHADRGATREIQALDQELGGLLSSEAAERSTLAGKRLLKQLSGARGERFLTKLQAAADAGTFPAHFLTVYATQSALFHLSLRLLLPGYAYWEWTAALQGCPPLRDRPPEFSRAVPGLQQTVQTSLSSHVFHAAQPFVSAAASAS